MEHEQGNPARVILMPHFSHNVEAAKSMQNVLGSIPYTLKVSEDPAPQSSSRLCKGADLGCPNGKQKFCLGTSCFRRTF